MIRLIFTLAALIPLCLFAQQTPLPEPDQSLSFWENKGQIIDQHQHVREDIHFQVQAGGLHVFLGPNGYAYQLNRVEQWKTEVNEEGVSEQVPNQWGAYRTDMRWVDANENPEVEGEDLLPAKRNFYTGSAESGITGVRSFAAVKYRDLYPGIDLQWYSREGALEYDFIVQPGADYRSIALEIDGATDLSVNEAGELVIQTPFGAIHEQAPIAFQEGRSIEARWVVNGSVVHFEVAEFDLEQELVIDPLIRLWGTYQGGSQNDIGRAVGHDATGVYMAGHTQSIANIATTGAHQTTYGGSEDAFVSAYDTQGVLLWSTYFGGNQEDVTTSLTVDPGNAIYVAGRSTSANSIATSGSHQPTYGGGSSDCLFAKFDLNGILQWATYFGGSDLDYGLGCAVTSSGDVYLNGFTRSTNNIATSGAYQTSNGGNADAFVAKFDANGNQLWGTYFGGSGFDRSWAMAIEDNGDLFITGDCESTSNIATSGAHQASIGGGYDAYLAHFDGTGNLLWSTYYGGSDVEVARAIVADGPNTVYLVGRSESTNNISTTGAFQGTLNTGSDAFVAKFDGQGVRQWGSYIGGSGLDRGKVAGLDSQGNVYVGGQGGTIPGITSSSSYQPNFGGGTDDAFLVQFDPNGNWLSGTFYGSSGDEQARGISISGNQLYLCGESNSSAAISTQGSQQEVAGGLDDAYLVAFESCQIFTDTAVEVHCESFTSPSGNFTWVTSGFYADSMVGADGCDSIWWYDLTIHFTTFETKTVIACDSFISPSGTQVWTSTGLYSELFTNSNGCDSTEFIDLIIINSSQASIVETACDFYISPSGQYIWTSSGLYSDTLTNNAGCDSVLMIDLNIINVDNGVNVNGAMATANQAGATYQWLDCEKANAPIEGETNQSISPTNGPIQVAVAINLDGCTDTSACVLLAPPDGVAESELLSNVRFFPNPVSTALTVQFGRPIDGGTLILRNTLGQVIRTQTFIDQISETVLPMHVPAGVYLLQIQTVDAQRNFRVVKQ